MRPRDLLRGSGGAMGGGPGGPRGLGRRLGDPIGPSGWFEESPDDS